MVHEHNLHARVVHDVLVIGRHQPVVERHEHSPNLRDRVVAFEEEVAVRAEDADAVALLYAQFEQRVAKLVHAVLELGIRVAPIAIDHSRLIRVKLGGAPQEVADQQGSFHLNLPPRKTCTRF